MLVISTAGLHVVVLNDLFDDLHGHTPVATHKAFGDEARKTLSRVGWQAVHRDEYCDASRLRLSRLATSSVVKAHSQLAVVPCLVKVVTTSLRVVTSYVFDYVPLKEVQA